MIFSHCTIYISCFSLTQSTCLQLKMPVDCDTEKDYVILDVWALVFSWKMDKILQGWEI